MWKICGQEIIAKIGKGQYATCYLTADNKVLKLYNTNGMYYGTLPRANFEKLKNGTYVFPEKYVFDGENKRYGIIMPFINSRSLAKKDITIEELKNAIDKVYLDTDALSFSNILTEDVYVKNILYDGSIKIIDTDFFELNDYFYPQELQCRNIAIINDAFINIMRPRNYKIHTNFINNHKNINEIYYHLNSFSFNNKLLKEYLIEIKKVLEEHFEEVVTLNDIKQSIIKLERKR